MPVSPIPPDDNTLRAFLLGTLSGERIEQVRAWLEADPAHVNQFDRLSARDPLMDVLSDVTAEVPVSTHAVERVVRGVSDSLHTPSLGVGDTRSLIGSVPPTATEPTPGWLPAQLGGYRILRELGHGGMGYVFEAEDEILGRLVAVKVLRPDVAQKPDATPRFIREARAAAAVEHENVVPILHIGQDGGVPYIVMPLLKGESLADRLKRSGKLSVAEVVSIGRDVAAGLAAAHATGMVHRDLKPANVWLDAGTGRARVLDFGLARQGDGADAMTEAGALLGTPAYVSPEQLDGQPATVRSDLFGLGAVLYECATGERAFHGPTITAILKAVSDHHPAPPSAVNSDVPPALSALIIRLLAKNPAERPATATEFLALLTSCSLNAPADGGKTVTWVDREAQLGSKRRRNTWIVAFAAIAVLATVGVWQGTRSPDSVAVKDPPPNPNAETPPGSTPPNPNPPINSTSLNPSPPAKVDPPAPVRYTGKVEVLVERLVDGEIQLVRLNAPGALPLKRTDKFRIKGEVTPHAYLYLVWVDPGHDVTLLYPWNNGGPRPKKEEPTGTVSLPTNAGIRYTAPAAKPGVATMVLFARSTPLDVPDDVVEKWFKDLPELPLPPGGDSAAIWFDDYVETRDPNRLRTFDVVGSDNAFARWQGQLQKSLGEKASFQTAVSFARTNK